MRTSPQKAGLLAVSRLSADECDRTRPIRGTAGRRGLGLSSESAEHAPVTSVVPVPPFVWVEVEFAGE